MSRTILDYQNLITSSWQDKPKYMAMIASGVSVRVRVQELMQSMMDTAFDVDVAIGAQLDVIGLWVGISRRVNIPIDGVFFSWDGTDPFLGWDYGVWQSSLEPTNIVSLPDDSYRVLIKAKIAANQWDGTTTGMYAIWDNLFPNITILIQDNQNMSYDLAFVGGSIDSLTIAIITGGYLPLKPEGVRVNVYYFPVDSGPMFGWDIESDYIEGWDAGSWAREITPS